MSNFAALMALSQTQTREAEAAVKTALAERERKETQRRKEQEEHERKERELEAKLRQKRMEEEKREQERRDRAARERAAKERELARKEEEQRNALLHGPSKKGRTDGNGYPAKDRKGKGAVGGGGGSSDDEEPSGVNALTREEKRKRKFELELQRSVRAARKSTSSSGRAGRRLPGGAVDITTTKDAIATAVGGVTGLSIREQFAAESFKLIRLNENKRDTRTIEEIIADRQKAKQAKVLSGEDAREFNDWFGKAKKDTPKKDSVQPSASTTRDNTPRSQTPNAPTPTMRSANRSVSPTGKPSAPSRTSSVPRTTSSKLTGTSSAKPIANTTSTPARPPARPLAGGTSSASGSRLTVTSKPSASSLKTTTSTKSIPKKRNRSSESLSPPPKRRTPAGASSSRSTALSAEIWKLFGKDRDRYVERDVFSDEEDMEAGASDLEREEMQRSENCLICFLFRSKFLFLLTFNWCRLLIVVLFEL